tara:strand:+ start:273 stop:2534 length:2262 start_codon:yes stop_codon:yes gene_type:complete
MQKPTIWPDYIEGFPYGISELSTLLPDYGTTPSLPPKYSDDFFEYLDDIEHTFEHHLSSTAKGFEWWASDYARAQIIPALQSTLEIDIDSFFQLAVLLATEPIPNIPLRELTDIGQSKLNEILDDIPGIKPILEFITVVLNAVNTKFENHLFNHGVVEKLLDSQLETLDERHRQILIARFPKDLSQPTLEQVAKSFRVTRERIRQIQNRALEKLIPHRFKDVLKRYISVVNESIIQKGRTISLIESDHAGLDYSLARLSWSSLLISRQLYGSPNKWLKEQLTEQPQQITGSNNLHVANVELNNWLTINHNEINFPVLLSELLELAGLSSRLLDNELPIHKSYELFNGYVVPKSSGRTDALRAISLHSILNSEPKTRSTLELTNEYCLLLGMNSSSAFSRILLSTLQSNGHLFLDLGHFGWCKLGDASAFHATSNRREMSDNEESNTGNGIRELIINELTEGPLKHVELWNRLRHTVKKGNIGPILSVHPGVFERLAPGLYGLTNAPRPSLCESLITIADCRNYVQAIHSGLPKSIFPAWTYELEWSWVRLCRRKDEQALLNSLLSISCPQKWPIDDEAKLFWEKQKIPALYQHDEIFQDPVFERLPCPRELWAILKTGIINNLKIGWCLINLVVGNRINDTHSSRHLANLIVLGLVKPANNWKAPHDITPKAFEFVEWCEGHMRNTLPSWGQLLSTFQASYNEAQNGWLARYEYDRIIDRYMISDSHPETDSKPSNSMDMLLEYRLNKSLFGQ